MMNLFGFLAVPLGWAMRMVYTLVKDYFLAIFLFTLIMRILMFPLSLQSQKKQAERIRLAPRLERLQKKYKGDPKKLQAKQQALYEKEGVSMTGGCLPMILQMVVLFGMIAVIYKPLTYLSTVDNRAVESAITAVNDQTYQNADLYTISEDGKTATAKDGGRKVDLTKKVDGKKNLNSGNYYRELKMMSAMEDNRSDILWQIKHDLKCDEAQVVKYYDEIHTMREQFSIGSRSLLENPWNEKGFAGISLLWLIPLISGITAVLSSLLSTYYSKQGMSGEKQPGQGCSNFSLMLFMPLFSTYIAFIVPGGVGVYWICSNLIAILQTWVLNMIYDPKKIRAQAEQDDEERRRRRQEEKKHALAEARRRDEEQERQEEARAAEPKDKSEKKLPLERGELKEDNDS